MEEMDEHVSIYFWTRLRQVNLTVTAQVGDLHTAITDREVEILEDIYNGVMAHQHKLLRAADALAQLDW